MCKKIVTTYPCAHQEEQFKPCDACATHCGTANYCKNIAVEQATSDDICIFDGCRWDEFEGIWRCCSCRKGPNREGICKWKVKGNPCGHNFCEECTGMAKRSSMIPGDGPDGEKSTPESEKKSTPPGNKKAVSESKKSTPPENKKSTTAENKQSTAGKSTTGKSTTGKGSASKSTAGKSTASKGRAPSTPSRPE